MPQVNVTIEGIVLYCDDSLDGMSLGNGYSIQKQYFDALPFKEKIVDGRNRLSINYLGSQREDDSGRVYFLCLYKEDAFPVQLPELSTGAVLTDSDLMCETQLEQYMDQERAYLNKVFTLLRVFKEGNIGPKEVFFTHKFSAGILHNTKTQTSDNVTRNIVDTRLYKLTSDEKAECISFLGQHSGASYDLFHPSMDEFVWGLEQTDEATGFEQYTTALEMTMLATGQQGKKQVLSKRTAVLLESNPADITALYNRMLDFYRFRSESLHEGDGQNITSAELLEMEGIVRRVMQKYLSYVSSQIALRPTVTWDELKTEKINDLKNDVQAAVSAGILPV
ncbi:MAG TPA: hypothetical protein DEV97_03590 [Lachnospiraceae bacterium]|nr:hypothetical protein [Lachnospiraceae bacterium]